MVLSSMSSMGSAARLSRIQNTIQGLQARTGPESRILYPGSFIILGKKLR